MCQVEVPGSRKHSSLCTPFCECNGRGDSLCASSVLIALVLWLCSFQSQNQTHSEIDTPTQKINEKAGKQAQAWAGTKTAQRAKWQEGQAGTQSRDLEQERVAGGSESLRPSLSLCPTVREEAILTGHPGVPCPPCG